MPWMHKYLGNPTLTAILNSFFHAASAMLTAACGITKRVYEPS